VRTGELPEIVHEKLTGRAFNQDIEFVEAPGSFQFRLEAVPAIGETPEKILKALALNADKMLQTGHAVIAAIQGANYVWRLEQGTIG
jgi:hypothetical protein